MALVIDARRRAMLAEMGVRVWLPAAASAPRLPAGTSAPAHAPRPTPHAPVPPMAPITVHHSDAPAPSLPTVSPPPQKTTSIPLDSKEVMECIDIGALQHTARQCQRCALHTQRHNSVWEYGAGAALLEPRRTPSAPRWLIVLDPPGEHENHTGNAAQDAAGQLLENMLAAVSLTAAHTYRAHATKCALPSGRNVQLDEIQSCAPFLQRELQLVQPDLVLALGRSAAYSVLGRPDPLGQLRGRLHHIQVNHRTVPVVVSYPLLYLLRHPAAKAQAWLDMGLALSATASPPDTPDTPADGG